jgi:hypothetical protein
MKRNVSVVWVCSAPNCCDTGKIIKEMLVSVASGTHCRINVNSMLAAVQLYLVYFIASVYNDCEALNLMVC